MQHWEQTYPVAGKVRLTVDQIEGATHIAGWEQPTVQVKASWPGEGRIEERLKVEQEGNALLLTVKPHRTGFLGLVQDGLLDLEIMVPMGSACEVEAGSGPVTIENTGGSAKADAGSGRVVLLRVANVEVETGSGSVQAHQVTGAVEIETGSGRIDVEAVGGPATLESGSGSIAARRLAGGLDAETSSGSIAAVDLIGSLRLESGSGSIAVSRVVAPSVELETGSGSVRIETMDTRLLTVETGSGRVEADLARVHPTGEYQIETGSGRIVVGVPRGAGLNLEVESAKQVEFSDMDLHILRQEDDEIVGFLNGGGARMAVTSGSGAIHFRWAETGAGELADPDVAATRLREIVKDDPALEQSQQMTRILQMVEAGTLSVDEAERLLRALDGEEE